MLVYRTFIRGLAVTLAISATAIASLSSKASAETLKPHEIAKGNTFSSTGQVNITTQYDTYEWRLNSTAKQEEYAGFHRAQTYTFTSLANQAPNQYKRMAIKLMKNPNTSPNFNPVLSIVPPQGKSIIVDRDLANVTINTTTLAGEQYEREVPDADIFNSASDPLKGEWQVNVFSKDNKEGEYILVVEYERNSGGKWEKIQIQAPNAVQDFLTARNWQQTGCVSGVNAQIYGVAGQKEPVCVRNSDLPVGEYDFDAASGQIKKRVAALDTMQQFLADRNWQRSGCVSNVSAHIYGVPGQKGPLCVRNRDLPVGNYDYVNGEIKKRVAVKPKPRKPISKPYKQRR